MDRESTQILIAPERGCEALDKSSIAELSTSRIDGMTSEELAKVIRTAALSASFRSDLQPRLDLCDRETLRRLAHLARRCCLNQGY